MKKETIFEWFGVDDNNIEPEEIQRIIHEQREERGETQITH